LFPCIRGVVRLYKHFQHIIALAASTERQCSQRHTRFTGNIY